MEKGKPQKTFPRESQPGIRTPVDLAKAQPSYHCAITRLKKKRAIMATYYNIFSTKENPQQKNYPTAVDSLRMRQKAIGLNQNPRNEDLAPVLGKDMEEHLFPIYEDWSNYDLLERCLGGHAQNANESFNATVWRLSPKMLHSGLELLISQHTSLLRYLMKVTVQY